MEEPLPVDVMDRLTRDFGDRAGAVAAMLLTRRRIGSADFLGEHLVRCVVHAAQGDERRVQELLAEPDYRDVIMAGEYDGPLRSCARDLGVSFLIDRPQKFWIGGLAEMMAARGYRLMTLVTCPATAGPFNYSSGDGEGRATFVGPKGEIALEKKDRQWMIHGNRRELEIHDLHHPYRDERAFRDKVSGYLLSNVRLNPDSMLEETPTTEGEGHPWRRFWKWIQDCRTA